MRPKIDAEFLMCFLQTDSFVKVVLDSCTGTSYPAINSNDLSNLEIDLPTSEDEQRRIGCFITNLDHLITLHQRPVSYTHLYMASSFCIGSSTTNLHPPYSRFSALIVPPALSTIRFTSARPRPFPSAL